MCATKICRRWVLCVKSCRSHHRHATTDPFTRLSALARTAGGYTLYITGHGDKNYTNELRALPEGVESGHFDVFFRIYVEVIDPRFGCCPVLFDGRVLRCCCVRIHFF